MAPHEIAQETALFVILLCFGIAAVIFNDMKKDK